MRTGDRESVTSGAHGSHVGPLLPRPFRAVKEAQPQCASPAGRRLHFYDRPLASMLHPPQRREHVSPGSAEPDLRARRVSAMVWRILIASNYIVEILRAGLAAAKSHYI